MPSDREPGAPRRFIAFPKLRGLAWVSVALLLGPAVLAWRAQDSPSLRSATRARPALLQLPSARFQMGSPEDEADRDSDEKLHDVDLSTFWMSETEVSQAQFAAVLGHRPWLRERDCNADGFVGDDLPVVCVTWLDAIDYCNELSRREGLEPVYTLDGREWRWDRSKNGYRLPTEAEWEYAARAGTYTRWVGTDELTQACQHGNVSPPFLCDDGHLNLAAVDEPRYRTNAFGVQGIGGNVSEWTWDVYLTDPGASAAGAVRDPVGPDTGSERTIRGASWLDTPSLARVANRCASHASEQARFVGFRVARSVAAPAR